MILRVGFFLLLLVALIHVAPAESQATILRGQSSGDLVNAVLNAWKSPSGNLELAGRYVLPGAATELAAYPFMAIGNPDSSVKNLDYVIVAYWVPAAIVSNLTFRAQAHLAANPAGIAKEAYTKSALLPMQFLGLLGVHGSTYVGLFQVPFPPGWKVPAKSTLSPVYLTIVPQFNSPVAMPLVPKADYKTFPFGRTTSLPDIQSDRIMETTRVLVKPLPALVVASP